MRIKPIADYLEESGVGTVGVDIFVQHLPEKTPGVSVMLKNSLDPEEIDYELPNYFRGKMQVIIRCKANKFEEGEELALLVSKTLTLKNATIDDAHFNYLRPSSRPIAYQLSDGANYEFSVNFAANYVIVG